MMRSILLLTLAIYGICFPASAQNDASPYHNFPVVVSIQFHIFSLPFRDMKSCFKHIGFGMGTEVSLNGKQNWTQQINLVWYRNKVMGNGLFFYTQTSWRPEIGSNAYTEIKGGAGYLVSFRPTESYRQVNGNWQSAGHTGKGMLAIPVGVSLGYNNKSQTSDISPFVTYQFVLASGYNKTVPIVPETLLQIGTRIHSK